MSGGNYVFLKCEMCGDEIIVNELKTCQNCRKMLCKRCYDKHLPCDQPLLEKDKHKEFDDYEK